mmetsp:Transcript_36486/g.81834  ORF Transcript_36486/g.81834 Transcript_36486/m.81834 type:complete len:471 (-) Transcript_36486:124-1536(-)
MPAPAYSKVGTDEEAADEEAAVAARFSTDRRASRVSSVDSLAADDDDQDAQDQKSKAQLLCLIIVIVAFFVLGIIDSFTTKFVKRGSIAFAMWTIEYAPWSFIVYCSIIGILIIGCLPYGPLSLLMGAVCTSLYGFAWGVTIGFLMLFTTTMVAGGVCFVLARYKFKTFVQRKINKSKKLRVLRNLDQIIKDGQGFEMVVLIRLAPLPTGPTQYFLGTTSVLWRDFLAANGVTNALFSISDIMMGAGAALLSKDNPVGLALFVIAVVAFFCSNGICRVSRQEEVERNRSTRKVSAHFPRAGRVGDRPKAGRAGEGSIQSHQPQKHGRRDGGVHCLGAAAGGGSTGGALVHHQVVQTDGRGLVGLYRRQGAAAGAQGGEPPGMLLLARESGDQERRPKPGRVAKLPGICVRAQRRRKKVAFFFTSTSSFFHRPLRFFLVSLWGLISGFSIELLSSPCQTSKPKWRNGPVMQ